jgi:hypothetical protein
MKKSKSKILIASVKLLTNFENPVSNLLQWLKDTENSYRKTHVTLKIISEVGYDTYTGENLPIEETQKWKSATGIQKKC